MKDKNFRVQCFQLGDLDTDWQTVKSFATEEGAFKAAKAAHDRAAKRFVNGFDDWPLKGTSFRVVHVVKEWRLTEEQLAQGRKALKEGR